MACGMSVVPELCSETGSAMDRNHIREGSCELSKDTVPLWPLLAAAASGVFFSPCKAFLIFSPRPTMIAFVLDD